MKLRVLADRLGAGLIGNGEFEIVKVNTIEAATENELTFLSNPKYRSHLETTRAGAVILKEEIPQLKNFQLIHPNPYSAFAQALTFFYPEPGHDLAPGIASTAVIDPTATTGDGVHIGNFVEIGPRTRVGDGSRVMAGTTIGPDCVIGKGCLFYPHVTIYKGTIIGNEVAIHSGTVIGSDGFGYATEGGTHHKIYQVGIVRIEDHVEIGSNCSVDRAALGETVIGAGTKIDNLVQIAHNVKIGKGCLIVSQVGISGSTSLGNYVILAGQVGLVGHIEIGDRAVVGAQSGVAKPLKADTVYFGSPAREARESKRIEAHIHHLPERIEQLKRLEAEVADLKARLEKLESE